MMAIDKTIGIEGGTSPINKPNLSTRNNLNFKDAFEKSRNNLEAQSSGFGNYLTKLNNEEIGVYEKALKLREIKAEVIAANIANADTPNYKAMDINVEKALLSSRAPQTLYSTPSQGSVDGNTVEVDSEQAKFADNALRHQYLVSKISEHYKDMENLLGSIPY